MEKTIPELLRVVEKPARLGTFTWQLQKAVREVLVELDEEGRLNPGDKTGHRTLAAWLWRDLYRAAQRELQRRERERMHKGEANA